MLSHSTLGRTHPRSLWQARDGFDLSRLLQKFEDGRAFNWDDLRQLLRRTIAIDRDRITADRVPCFDFLANRTEEERLVANDPHQRERALADRLRAGL